MGNNATENSAGKRIAELLDAGSFVEIGGAVTARNTDFNLQAKETPADGVITGYGVIDGNLVYVYSQDATVLNGSIGEMHAKKIAEDLRHGYEDGSTGDRSDRLCRTYDFRRQQTHWKRSEDCIMKQSMASGVIPQITAIFGTCGGGLAVDSGTYRFYIYGKQRRKTVCEFSKCIWKETKFPKCDTASPLHYQSETAGLVDGIGTRGQKFLDRSVHSLALSSGK